MQSSADLAAIEARQSKEKDELRKAHVREMLKRLDPSHKERITSEIFMKKLLEARDKKQRIDRDRIQEDFPDSFLAGIVCLAKQGRRYVSDNVFKKTLDKQRVLADDNVFNSLYEFLTMSSSLSQDGPNSSKFIFLSKLFRLTDEDKKEAKKMVACFVEVMEEMKREERNKYITEIVNRLQKISPEEFAVVLMKVEGIKLGMDFSRLHPLSFHFYRNRLRELIVDFTSINVSGQRIGVFDATYKFLTMPIGGEGKHSMKYLFLLFMSGCELKEEAGLLDLAILSDVFECLEIPNTNLAKFLASVFMKKDDKESSYIIQGVCEALDEIKRKCQASLHNFVEEAVNSRDFSKEKLVDAITVVRNECAKQRRNRSQEFTGAAANFFTFSKACTREAALDKLLEDLENKDQPITAQQALHAFLKNGEGSKGPHSFKYKLLKKLFPDLNKDVTYSDSVTGKDVEYVTKVESSAAIDSFIQHLEEYEKRVGKGFPLENMTRRNSFEQ